MIQANPMAEYYIKNMLCARCIKMLRAFYINTGADVKTTILGMV